MPPSSPAAPRRGMKQSLRLRRRGTIGKDKQRTKTTDDDDDDDAVQGRPDKIVCVCVFERCRRGSRVPGGQQLRGCKQVKRKKKKQIYIYMCTCAFGTHIYVGNVPARIRTMVNAFGPFGTRSSSFVSTEIRGRAHQSRTTYTAVRGTRRLCRLLRRTRNLYFRFFFFFSPVFSYRFHGEIQKLPTPVRGTGARGFFFHFSFAVRVTQVRDTITLYK